MKSISLEDLLEAGCHFGHQVTRQNPKARDYVFEERDNIHIIDLEKTKEGLEEAISFVKNVASKPGATMVVLGAKRQAQEIVRSEVKRAHTELATEAAGENSSGLYSVTNRWIGGIFTNFQEVAKNFRRLSEIDKLFSDEYEKAIYTKKELLLMERERQKLMSFYSGIVHMTKIPDLIYIIDTHLEELAVHEAKVMGVKVVGITDTNADPTIIDYAIPANDDAVGSIQLITSHIIDAWIEGKKAAEKIANSELQMANSEKAKEESKIGGANGTAPNAAGANGTKVIDAPAVAKPVYKQSVAGRQRDKAKSEKKKADEKAAGLTKEKKQETKATPEKISVE